MGLASEPTASGQSMTLNNETRDRVSRPTPRHFSLIGASSPSGSADGVLDFLQMTQHMADQQSVGQLGGGDLLTGEDRDRR